MQRLCANGKQEAALSEVEAVMATLEPSAELHAIHANVLRLTGNYGMAAAAWVEAAKLAPKDSSTWFGMAICLEQAGEEGGAFQAYAKAVDVEPKNANAFFKTIQTLQKAQFFGKVVERLDSADESIKQFPEWFALRSSAAFEMGDYRAVQEPPLVHSHLFAKNADLMALKLRAMVYDPAVDGFNLLQAARNWDRWFGPKIPPERSLNNPDPDRILRIGFVNTRMRKHNVGLQQYALMQQRPPSDECFIAVYSSNDNSDAVTQSIANMADTHIDISAMNDDQAVEAIRADHVDILVDYNEYANGGRMGVFARRAAPIQIHFYGNALSTGLRAMDYRIADPISEPIGPADTLSAEKILRLDKGYHFYEPPENKAAVVFSTPAKAKGFVTFGGIHHLAKYNPQVLALYKQILDAVPAARLLLSRNTLNDPQTYTAFRQKLADAGLPMDRIELRPDRGAIQALEFWQEVDCVLDTFPFGADASAMDSFYAGVPMITLLGQRIAGRRAASMLHLIGYPELITETLGEYVSQAIALAENIDRLQKYRKELHLKFESSPLRDHKGTAKAVFQMLRDVWASEVNAR